jgi:glutathione S-transferase
MVPKMLLLYHSRASVASIKVRLVLSEKGLPWQGKILNLHRGDQFQPEYRKINPNAVVPTLVTVGYRSLNRLIIAYLDEAFPFPALMPAEPYQRAIARAWMKRVDDLHLHCVALTFAIAFRQRFLGKTPEEIDARFAAIPDATMREQQRRSVSEGIDAPHVKSAMLSYDTFIAEMEKSLSRSPYLAGDSYSLADASAAPYVVRATMLAMDRLWTDNRPHVEDWFDRIRQRPSFEESITAVLTDADYENFNIARDETWQKIGSALSAVGRP